MYGGWVFSYGYLKQRSELRSCVKVEVAVLGWPSLIVRTVSVDVMHHQRKHSELCESGGQWLS